MIKTNTGNNQSLKVYHNLIVNSVVLHFLGKGYIVKSFENDNLIYVDNVVISLNMVFFVEIHN